MKIIAASALIMMVSGLVTAKVLFRSWARAWVNSITYQNPFGAKFDHMKASQGALLYLCMG